MKFYIAKQLDPQKDFYGQFRWYYHAANNRKVCWSGEYYTSEAAALDSIALVKENAANSKIYRENY
jgi:uncharacterized protein YegP (UPF0339 family)